jgi:hypothetical protein
MLFDKAKEDHSAGKISLDDLAQAWLDETKFCYAKHGGHVTHMIDFAEPYHWTFFVASNNNDMFGINFGSITIPCVNVPPETAALALIAYEKVISRHIWEFNTAEANGHNMSNPTQAAQDLKTSSAQGDTANDVDADVKTDAMRYRHLRHKDVDTIYSGGVFAGQTPQNYVLNKEDLDQAIDAEMAEATP